MEKVKKDDKDDGLEGVSSEANKRKLKASDVYSDDSGSDSDSGSDYSNNRDSKHGKRRQSSSGSSGSDSDVTFLIPKLRLFLFIKLSLF